MDEGYEEGYLLMIHSFVYEFDELLLWNQNQKCQNTK